MQGSVAGPQAEVAFSLSKNYLGICSCLARLSDVTSVTAQLPADVIHSAPCGLRTCRSPAWSAFPLGFCLEDACSFSHHSQTSLSSRMPSLTEACNFTCRLSWAMVPGYVVRCYPRCFWEGVFVDKVNI